MDSPTDFSAFTLRTFTVDKATFRVALTHDGTEAEADAFAADIERVVREAKQVFGELPQFDTNTYTFLGVYLPWANGDGMEHRNSTSLTGQGALRNPGQRQGMLSTVSHEFFHAWNMERIRSRSIEPFDFEEADVSDELWLGEGFTSYYDGLILARAGLQPMEALLGNFAGIINAVELSPGRRIRSAVDMSRLAPFVDAAACGRSHGLAEHVHFLLHIWLRDWTRARPRAARQDRWKSDARHLHAGALGDLRPAGTEGAGPRGDALHHGWPERDARRCGRRPRVRPGFLRAVYRRP